MVYITPETPARIDEKRFVASPFGLAVAAIVGYIACYDLERLRLPARVRAVASPSFIGIPLLALLGSTVVRLVVEARRLLERYPVTPHSPAT